jgi:hypothetical protein
MPPSNWASLGDLRGKRKRGGVRLFHFFRCLYEDRENSTTIQITQTNVGNYSCSLLMVFCDNTMTCNLQH